MKENPRQYLDMPAAVKRKKAVEWCMRLLRLDIDSMSYPEFYDFVWEYNHIVDYPEPLGISLLFTDPEEEEAARGAFKEYQKKAMELLDRFQENKNQPGHTLKFDMKMTFTARVMRSNTYKIIYERESNFEYSYARQIARLLAGKEFDNVFRKCPICNHYFAIQSRHKKQCCSHKCSMLHTFKNKSEEDLKLHRKRNNLQSHFSVLKKKRWTDKKIRSSLKGYIKSKKYTGKMIPKYIKEFIDNRG
jgi:hypothetical protein